MDLGVDASANDEAGPPMTAQPQDLQKPTEKRRRHIQHAASTGGGEDEDDQDYSEGDLETTTTMTKLMR